MSYLQQLKVGFVLLAAFLITININAATRTFNGNVSSDFNTVGNWSGSGALLSTDDYVITVGATNYTLTLSANITINNLTVTKSGSGGGGKLTMDVVTSILTVNGTAGFHSVSSNDILELNAKGVGDGFVFNGAVTFNTAGSDNGTLNMIANTTSPGFFTCKANATWGANATTVPPIEPVWIFDAAVSQTLTINITATNYYVMGEDVIFGSTNSPTVTIAGTNANRMYSYNGSIQINNTTHVIAGAATLDRYLNAGGSFTMASGSQLDVGVDNSFPGYNGRFAYTTYTINSNSTTKYYGTATTQDISAPNAKFSYGYLIIDGTGSKQQTTTGGITVLKDMTVSTGSTYFGNGQTITVTGDLLITGTYQSSTGTNSFKGDFTNNGSFTYDNSSGTTLCLFNGTSSQQIRGSAATTFYNFELDNTTGVTLAPSAGVVTTVYSSYTFTNGKMTIGNFDLIVGMTSGGGFFNWGSSGFIITNGTGVLKRYAIGTGQRTSAVYPIGINASSYTPVTITVGGATTVDNFSARVSQTVYLAGTTGLAYTTKVVDRTWNVSEGTVGGSNVTLTMQWNSGEELTFNRNSCLVSHYTGSVWANTTGLAAASGSNPYTRVSGNVTSFSPFAVTSTTTLPIELLSFGATPVNDKVNVQWKTASELNNDFFTVQRSANGADFEDIGIEKGAGNSKSIINYELLDAKPLSGVSYYRLKQTDFDGKSVTSAPVAVTFNSPDRPIMYPNPVDDQLQITFNLASEQSSQVRATVYDVTSKIVYSKMFSVQTGKNRLVIDLSALTSGVYFIVLAGDTIQPPIKFIKN